MKEISILIAAAFYFSINSLAPAAENYRGAAAVLAAAGTPKTAAAKPPADSPEKFRDELKAFTDRLPALAPDTAGEEWIDLALRLARFPHSPEEQYRFLGSDESDLDEAAPARLTFSLLLKVLPPPPAWEPMRRAIETRTKQNNTYDADLLRLLADWLTQNKAAFQADLKTLPTLKTQEGSELKGPEITLAGAFALSIDDGQMVLQNLNAALAQGKGGNARGTWELPDLVSLVGEEKAAEFLRRALKSGGDFRIEKGVETKALARKIALEEIDSLQAEPWSLIDSIEAAPLYEALAKKHSEPTEFDYKRQMARDYYLVSLIAQHRTEEAAALARQIGAHGSYRLEEAFAALNHSGHARDAADFFQALLARDPDLPFWQYYVAAAARSGQTEKMLQLAESAAAREDLTIPQRLRIQQNLRNAYLAADKLDAGLEILGRELKESLTGESRTPPDREFTYSREENADPGLEMVRLGIVLQRADLIDKGTAGVRAMVAKDDAPERRSERCRTLIQLANELLEGERGPEAEGILLDALTIENGAEPASAANFYSSRSESIGNEILGQLAAVYDRARRWPDVMALFEKAAGWNGKDLASIITQSVSSGRNQEYLGLLAARALFETGKKAEAERILQTLLDRVEGYDPAFELLASLKGQDALPRLEQLQARDQFEERPLIWKAKLLFDAGHLPEAETAARAAIAIDPSDGEEGPGRRMRVYAILAEIREARGDAKEAENLRGAVTAIRHSEDADRFNSVGLLVRAVAIYEEALTHFANAYCIQSRLALRLSDEGNFAAAEEHYRRAYELMPESFGRVESHCFGCEQAFAGARAQSLAEKVFNGLAAKTPGKPQVHYLLGYLRMEENRLREALPEFRKAVELDPEYLNAWKQLASIGAQIRLPAKEREAIQIKLLQLDPLGRHSEFEIDSITDFRAAWAALETAAKAQPDLPKTLLRLPAATARLDEEAKAKPVSGGRIYLSYSGSHPDRKNRAPANVIANHKFVQALALVFDGALRPRSR